METHVNESNSKQKLSKFFVLNQEYYLVNGALNCAIYDTKTEKVYWINEKSRQILEKVLRTNEDNGNRRNIFLNKLVELGIGEFVAVERQYDDRGYIRKKQFQINPFSLDFMWLELTNQCNLRCLHCYADATHDAVNDMQLSVNDWKMLIYEGSDLGCHSLQFTGGEVMLSKHLFELIGYAHDYGYTFIEVFTNATLLTPKFVKILKEKNVSLAISLYAADPESHDRITQVKGSFYRTVRAIKYLQEYDVSVRIATIAMLQNQDKIEEIKAFIEELGISYSGFDVICPSGRGKSEGCLPTKQSVLESSIMKYPIFWADKDKLFQNQFFNPCWKGKITITNSGDVLPCIMARDLIAGNVHQDPLRNIIEKAPLNNWWHLAKDQIKVCQDCEFRYACGDCRVLAIGNSGSLHAKYPRCLYDPYTGIWDNTSGQQEQLSRLAETPEITCVTPTPKSYGSSCTPCSPFKPCFPSVQPCKPCPPVRPCPPDEPPKPPCFPIRPPEPCIPESCGPKHPCPPTCFP